MSNIEIYHGQVRTIPKMQGWLYIGKPMNSLHHINRIKKKKLHCHLVIISECVWVCGKFNLCLLREKNSAKGQK